MPPVSTLFIFYHNLCENYSCLANCHFACNTICESNHKVIRTETINPDTLACAIQGNYKIYPSLSLGLVISEIVSVIMSLFSAQMYSVGMKLNTVVITNINAKILFSFCFTFISFILHIIVFYKSNPDSLNF